MLEVIKPHYIDADKNFAFSACNVGTFANCCNGTGASAGNGNSGNH